MGSTQNIGLISREEAVKANLLQAMMKISSSNCLTEVRISYIHSCSTGQFLCNKTDPNTEKKEIECVHFRQLYSKAGAANNHSTVTSMIDSFLLIIHST